MAQLHVHPRKLNYEALEDCLFMKIGPLKIFPLYGNIM